jgi:hypothetical protein
MPQTGMGKKEKKKEQHFEGTPLAKTTTVAYGKTGHLNLLPNYVHDMATSHFDPLPGFKTLDI